jgi:hypothetical protein
MLIVQLSAVILPTTGMHETSCWSAHRMKSHGSSYEAMYLLMLLLS